MHIDELQQKSTDELIRHALECRSEGNLDRFWLVAGMVGARLYSRRPDLTLELQKAAILFNNAEAVAVLVHYHDDLDEG